MTVDLEAAAITPSVTVVSIDTPSQLASSSHILSDTDDAAKSPCDSSRICRICQEAEFVSNKLITPCDCRGSMEYVHFECLKESILVMKNNKCTVCKQKFSGIDTTVHIWRSLLQFVKDLPYLESASYIVSFIVFPYQVLLFFKYAVEELFKDNPDFMIFALFTFIILVTCVAFAYTMQFFIYRWERRSKVITVVVPV